MSTTREAWLIEAVAVFRPRFESVGKPLPPALRVSVRYCGKSVTDYAHILKSGEAVHPECYRKATSDGGEVPEGFSNDQGEVKFKIDGQWYYRGNRSPTWMFIASRPDGSCQGGISEKVPSVMWPLLNEIARLRAPQEGIAAAQEETK